MLANSDRVTIGASLLHMATGGLVAALGEPQLLQEGDVLPFDIFASPQLLGLCLMGAIAGAYLSIIFFPPYDKRLDDPDLSQEDRQKYDNWKSRRILIKFFSSSILGVCCTPVLFELTAIMVTAAKILSFSLLVGLLGVSILHIFLPKLEEFLSGLSIRDILTYFLKIFTKEK